MISKLLCSCNGKPCNGECRETHLYRKRKDLNMCPAAYDEKKERRRRNEKG